MDCFGYIASSANDKCVCMFIKIYIWFNYVVYIAILITILDPINVDIFFYSKSYTSQMAFYFAKKTKKSLTYRAPVY